MLTHGEDDRGLGGTVAGAAGMGVTTGIDAAVDGLVACGIVASRAGVDVGGPGTETSESTTSPAPSVVSRGLAASSGLAVSRGMTAPTGVVAAIRAAVSADVVWAFD
ncbi:MAG TPA: hypothetical protein VFJ20_10555 [Gemmatimonadaceae bacterium]|nr:hypothetical protein [Gemmatimonadaceae bacterium]